MPYGGPPEDELGPTQGIAGGPQPTPSGVDDGTPRPGEPKAGLPPGEAQRDAGRTAGRSGEGAGERGRDEHPEHVYDDPPEGKDPPPAHGA